jgi:hypothetical protein
MKIPLKVELRHPAIGKITVAASDMSDGGVFLLIEDSSQLQVGESVLIRTLGLGINGSETGPPLVMTVVRQTSEGIGLAIENTASANLASWDSENLARQAIRQSLVIVNDYEQLLITQRGLTWCLPHRQLLSSDTWQLGIEAMLADLEILGAIGKDHGIIPQPVCLPTALGEPGSIDLLILCHMSKQYLSDDLSTNLSTGKYHKWVAPAELQAIIPALDSKLVDKALKQARH